MNIFNGQSHASKITRPYAPEDVTRLQGSARIEHTLASLGARQLRSLLEGPGYVTALGVMTGNQAVQAVRAGLEALYLSGWQVAADSNLGGETYPDQSLYPVNSAPRLVERINNALQRADQIARSEGDETTNWYAPIVADGEAGFGGPLNVFELTKSFIRAGAAAVHFEDQLASEKKCGHMGGKVLIPARTAIRNLVAARLAADVLDVPTLIVARTDANGAKLITSDVDPLDRPFLSGERTEEGFFRIAGGLEMAIPRGRTLRRSGLVRNVRTGFGRSGVLRGRHPRKVPWKMARLQLFSVIQLEAQTLGTADRGIQRPHRRNGLQVPVRDAGRFPRAQPLHVRVVARISQTRDGGLFGFSAARIRKRARRLHGDAPPARSRRRLFRCGRADHRGRNVVDDRPRRLHRRGAIRSRRGLGRITRRFLAFDGFEDPSRSAKRLGCDRHAAVDSRLEKDLGGLFFGDAVVERPAHVNFELVPTRHHREHREIEHAPSLAFEPGPNPNVSPAKLLGEVDEVLIERVGDRRHSLDVRRSKHFASNLCAFDSVH